jgi:hypothetical protein
VKNTPKTSTKSVKNLQNIIYTTEKEQRISERGIDLKCLSAIIPIPSDNIGGNNLHNI